MIDYGKAGGQASTMHRHVTLQLTGDLLKVIMWLLRAMSAMPR